MSERSWYELDRLYHGHRFLECLLDFCGFFERIYVGIHVLSCMLDRDGPLSVKSRLGWG